MRTFNYPIVTVTSPITLNANYNSPYVPLKQIYTYAIQMTITGSCNGTVKLQASADPETNDTQTNTATALNAAPGRPPAVAPTNWCDIVNSSFAVTATGVTFWNVNFTGYNYVRVAFTDSSGGTSTATASIIFNGKG